MTQITTYTRSAIIINVSNPMDILTYIAQKEFNYPPKSSDRYRYSSGHRPLQ